MDRMLTMVAGVAETTLTEALLAGLPDTAPPPPWTCRCDAVVWFGRGGSAARTALPPALRRGGSGLATVGAVVGYEQSPVGRYDELLGVVGSLTAAGPWGSVAFMAVDSPESLVGGRTGWALPKTLGRFAREVSSGSTVVSSTDGPGWQVGTTARATGPALPLAVAGTVRQQFPDGRVGGSRLAARGLMRPALVKVEVSSAGALATWLRPGRHVGAVLGSVTLTLFEPRFA